MFYKFKSVLAVLILFGLTACSNQETILDEVKDNDFVYAPDDSWQTFDYTFVLDDSESLSPKESRYNAQSFDQLWSFADHDIENFDLWYAIYYLNTSGTELLYDFSCPDAPKPTKVGNYWNLSISIPATYDKNKVYICAAAGSINGCSITGKKGSANTIINGYYPDFSLNFRSRSFNLGLISNAPSPDKNSPEFYMLVDQVNTTPSGLSEILVRPYAEAHLLLVEEGEDGPWFDIIRPEGEWYMAVVPDGTVWSRRNSFSPTMHFLDGNEMFTFTESMQAWGSSEIRGVRSQADQDTWKVTIDGKAYRYLGVRRTLPMTGRICVDIDANSASGSTFLGMWPRNNPIEFESNRRYVMMVGNSRNIGYGMDGDGLQVAPRL